MKYQIKKSLIFFSVACNLFISLPAVVIFLGSSTIRFDLYQQHLAHRLGKPEIVFIGDSLTAFGKIWNFRIGEFNFNVWNMGHGGFTTRQILFYAKIASKYKDTRYAFVMAGINDPDKSIAGAEKTFADYMKIIDTLLDGGVQPVIELTLYRENEPAPEFIDRLNDLLKKYAGQRNLKVIDLNPILAPNKSLLDKYSIDGVHLTEAAYNVWGDKVKDVLDELRTEQNK